MNEFQTMVTNYYVKEKWCTVYVYTGAFLSLCVILQQFVCDIAAICV
jgi:hypothetical protein